MQQWDGTKWVKITDWIAPMKEKVRPMLEEAAKDYVIQEPALAEAHASLATSRRKATRDEVVSPRFGGERHSVYRS